MKNRVVIIGPLPPPQGGVASVVQFLLTSTLNQDFELLHLDISRKSGLQRAGRLSAHNLFGFFRQLLRLCQIMSRKRPHLVHLPITSGWSFWKQCAFYLVIKLFGAKTLLHVHGGGFMVFYEEARWFTRYFVRSVFDRANGVVVLSKRWRRFVETFVTNRQRIRIIPNSVSPQFIETLKNNSEPGKGHKTTRILFVGHLIERKGVFEILQAIPEVLVRHPNVVFAFAGPEASEGIKARMECFCSARNCSGQVELLGELHGDAKAAAFKSASMFLLPSYAENLSVAILEAMCAGLPIITTPVGANIDILQEGKNCLFVRPRDSRSVADAICFLIENEPKALQMGQNNRQAFECEFLPGKVIDQFRDLYTQLCASNIFFGTCGALQASGYEQTVK